METPLSLGLDKQRALARAQSEAARLGYDLTMMEFVFVDAQLRHPHITAEEVLAWGKISSEEQQTTWILYGFPKEQSQQGGDILVLVDKASGSVTRVLAGQ